MRLRYGITIAGGQDHLKGKIVRIAHIGYYDYMDTIGILAALEHVLAKTTGKPVALGAAVKAAQEVFAKAQSGKSAELAGVKS